MVTSQWSLSGSRRGDKLPVQPMSDQPRSLQLPQREPDAGQEETQADGGPALQALSLTGATGVIREPGTANTTTHT